MCHKQRGCQSTRTVGAILRPGGKKSDPLRVAPPSFKSFSTASDAQKRRQIQNVCLLCSSRADPLCFLITVLAFVIIIIVVVAVVARGEARDQRVRFGSTGFNFDRRRRRQWRRRRRGAFLTPPPEERQLPRGEGGKAGRVSCC